MALNDIPGYGAYVARRQMNEQKPLEELKMYGGLQAVLAGAQKQSRDQAFRDAMAALGENPTQEALAGVAAKYASPGDLLKVHQSSMDRKAALEASASEKDAALQAAKEQRLATLEQSARFAEMAHEARMARAATDAERVAETKRHNKQMELIQGQLAELRVEKPPAGYRKTPEGNLEAIPGGPADVKQQGVLNQDTSALNTNSANLDRLATAANELLQHPGLVGITGLRGAVPDVPGTAAADARAKLLTLKAQTGFNTLQEMRNASKTGGAVGQVTEKEWPLLQSAIAALETAQSEKQMRESLQKVIQYTDGAKDRLRQAYNMKHGDKTSGPASPPKPAADAGPKRITSDAEYDALPSGAEFIGPDGKKRRKP